MPQPAILLNQFANLANAAESPSFNMPKAHKYKCVSKKNSAKKKICCSCQKSRCLKLYCDCFAYGQYCEGCNCVECMNRKECDEERKKAMVSIKDRNPLAELNQTNMSEEKQINKPYFKGCQCKKSNCRKKYCECFLAKKPCSSQCKCEGCMNSNGCEDHSANVAQMVTPITSTPFTDCKSSCSSNKSKKRHITPFVPDSYTSFTKKYSTQSQSNKKKMRAHN